VREADLILALDVKDAEPAITALDRTTRQVRPITPDGCRFVEIGFSDLGISKWSTDYGRYREAEISILADTALAVPLLAERCAELVNASPARRAKTEARTESLSARSAAAREGWLAEARADWSASPMTTGRLALEVWDAIQHEDWVLTANALGEKARRLWDMDQPYRHPGRQLGTATQIGISLGVALAHKGTGRLVVDIQPDGDLMFDAGALWVATKHQIPLLVVMYNNRAYYNDWEHQIRVARHRGTPPDRAGLGMELFNPSPDFAMLARSMGWYAEGPIEDPADLAPALRRAIAEVKAGRPALVDTVTRFR
jgi:acetolactate synthase-1/2/3 large subunit